MPLDDSEEAKHLCELAEKGQLEKLVKLVTCSNVNVSYRGWTPLMRAADSRNNRGLACVEQLLKAGADPAPLSTLYQTAMHLAARSSNTQVMQLLHLNDPSLLNLQTKFGETPLMWAAASDCAESVRLLLGLGADACVRNWQGKTAADKARELGSRAAYKILVAYSQNSKADEKETKSEETEAGVRLCEAAAGGQVSALPSLLSSAVVNLRHRSCSGLVWAAAGAEDSGLECSRLLLEAGADSSVVNDIGATALHAAAGSNSLRLCEILIRHSPSLLNSRTKLGETPLMWAAALNNSKVVRLLIESGADLLARSSFGETAADLAKSLKSWTAFFTIEDSQKSHSNSVDFVSQEIRDGLLRVEQEAKSICSAAEKCNLQQLQQQVNSGNCNCRWKSLTPLMWAAKSGRIGCEECTECVILLLKLGADPALGDWQGWTPAHFAANAGNCIHLKLLPQFCINLTDRAGQTPMVMAYSRGDWHTVQLLMEMGSHLTAHDFSGNNSIVSMATSSGFEHQHVMCDETDHPESPPHEPVTSENLDRLMRQVNSGNVNGRVNGKTLLMHASESRDTCSLAFAAHLLKLGADTSAATKLGFTAAHLAVQAENAKMLKLLHSHNPSLINQQNRFGETPLMRAAALNSMECAMQILQLGADLTLTDGMGQTAADTARILESWAAYNILLDAGRKEDFQRRNFW